MQINIVIIHYVRKLKKKEKKKWKEQKKIDITFLKPATLYKIFFFWFLFSFLQHVIFFTRFDW
jgi:hypothetical protein